jgi:hypothetical protein
MIRATVNQGHRGQQRRARRAAAPEDRHRHVGRPVARGGGAHGGARRKTAPKDRHHQVGVRTRQGKEGAKAPPGVPIGSDSGRSVKAWRPPVFGEFAGATRGSLVEFEPKHLGGEADGQCSTQVKSVKSYSPLGTKAPGYKERLTRGNADSERGGLCMCLRALI